MPQNNESRPPKQHTPEEYARLQKRCSDQRRELKRLNRKIDNVKAAARATELGQISKAELQHEINKLARRAQIAESDNESLRAKPSKAAE